MTYPGWPPPPFPPPPSGATAITAGVLAVIGGVWHLLGFVAQLLAMLIGDLTLGAVISLLIALVIGGLLIAGGIQLFRRRPDGRAQTIIGCSLAILDSVAGVVLASSDVSWPGGYGASVAGATVALLFTLPAVATLVLAAVPPTTRWLSAGPRKLVIP